MPSRLQQTADWRLWVQERLFGAWYPITLSVLGLSCLLLFGSLAWEAQQPNPTSWLVGHIANLILLSGCLVTGLLLFLIHTLIISRRRADMLSIVRNDDLVDREHRLAALFHQAPIGIMRCDKVGRILQVNTATVIMTGCEAALLVGQEMATLFDPHSEARLRAHASNTPFVAELQLNSTRAELIPVMVQVLPLRAPNRQPYSWVLMEDLRNVRHADRMKMQFVSTISHELRTPLTVIRSSIELLALEALSEDGQILVQAAENNAQRLQHLIDNLLDFERLNTGALSLTPRLTDVRQTLQQVAHLMEPLVAQKQLGVDLALPNTPLIAWVDEERLLQVVMNLVSNAIKFSPPSGTVRLVARRSHDGVEISVADQGPGIPEAFRPRLFQPFAQADGDDNRRWGGSGLGLCISHTLVQRMGGILSLVSPPHTGAQFLVSLPHTHPPIPTEE